MDPVLVLSFNPILVLSFDVPGIGRRRGGRRLLRWGSWREGAALPCTQGCPWGCRLGDCTGMPVLSKRDLNHRSMDFVPRGASNSRHGGQSPLGPVSPSLSPCVPGAARHAEMGIPRCPHPHSRQQVGSLEPLEPLLQDLRHRLAAPLPHVRGHRRAGLPLRGHRRGGEDLQREEVPR